MFTLRQLQMFEAVARLGNYSKAAEELGVSQPSVSVQVKDLETELGVELFERGGRRSRLTEVGTAFYGKAAQIIAAVEESLVEVDAYLGLERGRLRIGAIESIGLYLLPGVMAKFAEAHPAIDVELTLEHPDQIARGLELGRLDFGFVDVEFEGNEAFESLPLGTARLVVITGRQHPLGLQQKSLAAPLAQHTFIVEGKGSPSFRGLEWLAAGMEGAVPSVGMQVTGCDALKQMVRAQLGIAVTYSFCVESEQQAGQLHILDISDLGPEVQLYLISTKGGGRSPASQAFIALAEASLKAAKGRVRRS